MTLNEIVERGTTGSIYRNVRTLVRVYRGNIFDTPETHDGQPAPVVTERGAVRIFRLPE